VKSWKQDFCILEYPTWKENKTTEAAAQAEDQEKQQQLNYARENKPKCKCGHSFEFTGEKGICTNCSNRCFFNYENGTWEFCEPLNLSEEYNRVKQNHRECEPDSIREREPENDMERIDNEPVAVQTEEIEF
jgi:hypothetical protein